VRINIQDSKSANGTYIVDPATGAEQQIDPSEPTRIFRVRLEENELFRLGDHYFVVRRGPPPGLVVADQIDPYATLVDDGNEDIGAAGAEISAAPTALAVAAAAAAASTSPRFGGGAGDGTLLYDVEPLGAGIEDDEKENAEEEEAVAGTEDEDAAMYLAIPAAAVVVPPSTSAGRPMAPMSSLTFPAAPAAMPAATSTTPPSVGAVGVVGVAPLPSLAMTLAYDDDDDAAAAGAGATQLYEDDTLVHCSSRAIFFCQFSLCFDYLFLHLLFYSVCSCFFLSFIQFYSLLSSFDLLMSSFDLLIAFVVANLCLPSRFVATPPKCTTSSFSCDNVYILFNVFIHVESAMTT
jgi:hypothetical protein